MGSRGTRTGRGDAGAASLEFAALSAVVAVLVGAVAAAFAGAAPAVGDTVRAGICRILTLGQGACASPSAYADRLARA